MSSDVNEFSAEPVQSHQLVNWPRVAAISVMATFSLPSFITGLEIYNSVSADDLIGTFLLGSLIITLVGGVIGTIGTRTRLSSYLLVRIAFGDKGAGFVNLLFALSLLGWFGVNIDLFSAAVLTLLETEFGAPVPVWWIEVLAGLLMTITTMAGFRAINAISSLFVPVMVGVTGYLAYKASEANAFSTMFSNNTVGSLTLGDGVAAIVGVIIIGAIILPDITRFIRQQSGGVYTAVSTYFIVSPIVMLVAAAAGAATGRKDMLDVFLALQLGGATFVIVIAGSWILNAFNLYSTVLSVEATFPALNGRWVTLILGGVGVVAASLNILDQFIPFLSILAVVFVPVAGILGVDWYVLRKDAYSHDTLDNNIALNWRAFLGWLVGSIHAIAGTFYALPTLTSIPILDAILVTAVIYYVLARKVDFIAQPAPSATDLKG